MMYSVDDLFSKITGCREKGGSLQTLWKTVVVNRTLFFDNCCRKAATQCPTHFSLSRAYIHVGRNPVEWPPRQQNQSTRVNIQWFVRIMCADTWIIECANPFDKPLF